ncbi:MAG: DUF2155 domain-containing protein [Alphaproteobacteria bacterium]|nr:DUF2155 domain-containing protein [Alphaproteobacteria bacterium]
MRLVSSLLLAAGAVGLSAALAVAQEAPEEHGPSELDLLSRNADDPFAGVIDAEKRAPVSVTLRALDKITARYTDIEIEMNQIARFGPLEIQPRYCDQRPPEEFPETTAFLEIFDTEFGSRQSGLKIALPEVIEEEIEPTEFDVLAVESIDDSAEVDEERLSPPLDLAPERLSLDMPVPEVLEGPQAEGVNIFRGWMFASSPALNALEHPVYDVWVISCATRLADS